MSNKGRDNEANIERKEDLKRKKTNLLKLIPFVLTRRKWENRTNFLQICFVLLGELI